MEQSEYPKDSKDLPFVVIVSVNWNGWRDTLECLESVRRLDYPNYLMIVVDNASRDDSLARIREWAEKKEGYLLVEYPETVARAGGEVVQEQALTAALPASRAVLIRSAVNAAITGGGNLAIEYALRRDQPVDYVFMLENDAKAEAYPFPPCGGRPEGKCGHRWRSDFGLENRANPVCRKNDAAAVVF
jgi:GT2 family glycosyltransferase